MRKFIAALLAFMPAALLAQTQSAQLTVSVSSVEGDVLTGQPVSVTQTDYEVGYGNLKLNAEGKVSLKVYPGNHRVEIDRPGFIPVSSDFVVAESETEKLIEIQLQEKVRTPFALQAVTTHDPYSGKDAIDLSWNVTPPVFFDDFESYSPFAIEFGDWSGIDGDSEATAALMGVYPNRGVMQYAQIINPLTVQPTWWYDYPVLRPYAGQQYVGFIRTSSGNANDDWLISPVITPGQENELSFMAKAADRWPERFMVYVTEKTDNPTVADFMRIDTGNHESVDYKQWQKFSYNLDAYAGKPIRFAIRYVADTNRYGAYMLMIDDVYVGQRIATPAAAKSQRVARSADNPNESFLIFIDGKEVGTTEQYEFTISDVTPGEHTIGVQAKYRAALSEKSEIDVTVPVINYAKLDIELRANSILEPSEVALTLLDKENARQISLTTSEGKASVASLWPGEYTLRIEEGAYELTEQQVTVDSDKRIELLLEDNVIDPFNLTAYNSEDGVNMTWNLENVFNDSFEDYPDFATGEFGDGWKTIDADGLPVYPIGLGSTTNIVSFPGSGSGTNPMPVAPMVFNPWETTPPMLPTDEAIKAPTGDKTVIFFSPQNGKANKWLISPLLNIRSDFEFSVSAKGYSIYPECIELCISDGGTNPSDFTPLATVDQLTYTNWSRYSTPLADYAGQGKRLAVHYTSYDAFLAQVDDFRVGPAEDELKVEDYGNVVSYELFVDGKSVDTTAEHSYTFTDLEPGTHRLGVKAKYKTRESGVSEIEITTSGISGIEADETNQLRFDLLGRKAGGDAKGIIITNRKKILK
ncbi:MAG: choice-of-anchor J domain-containing protein [Muribaculaceae bacterium]|nr:choice-of-anchor J domain-containing protein [Muribaculaceae bacterium]